jgi:pentatricopeptide repeat protein
MLYSDFSKNADHSKEVYNLFPIDFALIIIFFSVYFTINFINTKYVSRGQAGENSEINKDLQSLIDYIRQNKNKDAFTILNEIQANRLATSRQIFQELLLMCIRLRQFQNVEKLYELLADDYTTPFTIDKNIYEILLRGVVEESSLREIKCDVSKLNSKIQRYLHDIKKREIILDNTLLHLVIDAYCTSQQIEEAWELHKTFLCKYEDYSSDPENMIKVIFMMIEGYLIQEKQTDLLIVNEILDYLKTNLDKKELFGSKYHQELIVDFYNKTLLNLFSSNSSDLDLYIQNYDSLIDKNFRTYEILVFEYGKLSNIEMSLFYYKELSKSSISAPKYHLTKFYQDIIKLLIFNNKFETVNVIHQKMVDEKVPISPETYTDLIKINSKLKSYLKCIEIYESISQETLNNSKIDLFNSVMDFYLECGLYRKVLNLFEIIKRKNEEFSFTARPNIYTLVLVLKAFTLSGRMHEARQIYNLIKEKNKNMLSTEAFNSIAECFLKVNEVDMALAVLNEMKVLGLSRDCSTYSLLLSIYSQALNEEKCILIYDETMRNNIKPNLEILSSLISLFIKKKKIIQAIGIYTDIKLNKISCTESVYHSIIIACLTNNKIDNAFEIIIDSYSNKIKLSLSLYKNFLDSLINLKSLRQIEKSNYVKIIENILKDLSVDMDEEILGKFQKLNKN